MRYTACGRCAEIRSSGCTSETSGGRTPLSNPSKPDYRLPPPVKSVKMGWRSGPPVKSVKPVKVPVKTSGRTGPLPDLLNLPRLSLGRTPKIFLRSAKDNEKRRKLMENAENFLRHTFSRSFPSEKPDNFSSPHNVLSGPDQRYRASLRDRGAGHDLGYWIGSKSR